MYTPFTDDEPGQAATFNLRFAEMEAAITARRGAMIASTTPTTLAADAANITIDIVAGYDMLTLHASLRTNRAAANDDIRVTFNDDISSSYITRYILCDTVGAPSAGGATSTSGLTLGYGANGATATANTFSSLILRIPLASASLLKGVTWESVQSDSSITNPRLIVGGGWYPTASVITRIKLAPVTGTLIVTGSSYAVYGTGG